MPSAPSYLGQSSLIYSLSSLSCTSQLPNEPLRYSWHNNEEKVAYDFAKLCLATITLGPQDDSRNHLEQDQANVGVRELIVIFDKKTADLLLMENLAARILMM